MRQKETIMSLDQAFNPDFNVGSQVYDLQLFVNAYFAEVERSEKGYIEIYSHIANEFSLLKENVLLKMD